jgi:hypothetical protein
VEPEQLLELIDDNQKVLVFRQVGLADGLDQPQRAAPEGDFDEIPARSLFSRRRIQSGAKRVRQSTDGIASRAKHGDAPVGTSAGKRAAHQRGNQAGPHQGRLAASRRSQHRHETRLAQTPQKLVGLRFPPEEKIALVRFERP